MQAITIFAISTVLSVSLLGQQTEAEDFEIHPAERPPSHSSKHLTDQVLTALGEQRLDERHLQQANPAPKIVRIIILPSFRAPIMIKWFAQPSPAESRALVRHPELTVTDRGEVSYPKLLLDHQVVLTKGQTLALNHAKDEAGLGSAPANDWRPSVLDGSRWIIETSGPDGYHLLSRTNLDLESNAYELELISKERIAGEARVTYFCKLLWNLVGVNDLLYFPNNNGQQPGTGQPATRPESKSEGGDKPQPEAEGRSR